jgi:hypothetical protein
MLQSQVNFQKKKLTLLTTTKTLIRKVSSNSTFYKKTYEAIDKSFQKNIPLYSLQESLTFNKRILYTLSKILIRTLA